VTRRVIAVVPDLFFATKIAATAEAAAVTLEVLSAREALERCRAAPPALLILDLSAGEAPLDLARALRADAATAGLPIAGFYSHVEGGTRLAALAAGVDPVLPRSAFVQRLPALLTSEGAPGYNPALGTSTPVPGNESNES